MARSLGPKGLFSQDPKGPNYCYKIEPMGLRTNNEYIAFSKRLHQALDDAGVIGGRGRQTALGKMFGVTARSGAKWLKGKAIPQTARIAEIANRLKVRGEWLLTGKGPMRDGTVESPLEYSRSNVSPGPHIQGELPLLSWVQAGDSKTIIDRIWNIGDDDVRMVKVAKTGGPYSFCLRVDGDSMTASEGKFSFPEGIIIQIDPDVPAKNGSYVIARFCDTNEATFKQLMIDGGHKYLKPLNPRYPVINCNSNIEILGVVFGAVLDVPC